jgi:16S rRNA (adenine1518-N6/adenine1519-N6)-dimethyltransferase
VRAGPRKALGQHFLTDGRILSRVLAAAEITSEDTVLEVGPGRGALTRRLVGQAARVIALELDPQLAAALPAHLDDPPNLTVVEADARKVDIGSLLGPDAVYKVVGNLPYYAANPIVRRFLESIPQPRLMVVMVQQEVARSMAAGPGKMGLLSVATQFYAVPRIVCSVPPRVFRPPPKVTSALVRLEVRAGPPVDVADPDAFFSLVRAGFSAPRKQLRNSLGHGLGVANQVVGRLLSDVGLDGSLRPANLSLEDWAMIYRAWVHLS